HLTRILFHDVDWQQNTAAHVWAEFGINPKNPPPQFKDYGFDLLLIGKPVHLSAAVSGGVANGIIKAIGNNDSSAHDTYQDALKAGIEKPILDPVDYSANQPWQIAGLPGHNIYSNGASLVDFDLSWDIVAGHSSESTHFRRTREQGAEIVFVNGGTHHWLEIDFQLEKDGVILDANPMPKSLFALNYRPMQAIGTHTVRATCPDICDARINRIKLNLPQGVAVTVSGVRFGS
ncbi:MAG: hypothetical protein HY850_06880, partial [Betaproteobacteria bacterium]|nr:hypothetical protein [Betaproteobacteria bacterium]